MFPRTIVRPYHMVRNPARTDECTFFLDKFYLLVRIRQKMDNFSLPRSLAIPKLVKENLFVCTAAKENLKSVENKLLLLWFWAFGKQNADLT